MKGDNMKKIIAILLMLLFKSGLFAIGIGPQISFGQGFLIQENMILITGASCSIKLDKEPVVINIATNYDHIIDCFNPEITVDYWLFSPKISKYCNYFLGIGMGSGVEFSKNDFHFTSTKRLVTGFSWTYYDGFLEYFMQLTAEEENHFKFPFNTRYAFKFPLSLGVRFYY